MARITTGDCESVVPNRNELVPLAELARELPSLPARGPACLREAKAVTALRQIARHAADPETLRSNRWRRMSNVSLGRSNDNHPSIDATAGEVRAA